MHRRTRLDAGPQQHLTIGFGENTFRIADREPAVAVGHRRRNRVEIAALRRRRSRGKKNDLLRSDPVATTIDHLPLEALDYSRLRIRRRFEIDPLGRRKRQMDRIA